MNGVQIEVYLILSALADYWKAIDYSEYDGPVEDDELASRHAFDAAYAEPNLVLRQAQIAAWHRQYNLNA